MISYTKTIYNIKYPTKTPGKISVNINKPYELRSIKKEPGIFCRALNINVLLLEQGGYHIAYLIGKSCQLLYRVIDLFHILVLGLNIGTDRLDLLDHVLDR